MTTDIDDIYLNRKRLSAEDLGNVKGFPKNLLYYINDALGFMQRFL